MKPPLVAAPKARLSTGSAAASIESHGCLLVLRRVDGPGARELFIHCRPAAAATDAGQQAESIYRAIRGVLEAEGASFGSVVSEMVFLRDLRQDIGMVRAARLRALDGPGAATHRPATLEIEQPPLNEQARLEVLVQAVLPNEAQTPFDVIDVQAACGCADCASAHGLRVQVGAETRFHAAALYGPGDDAYQQTLGMFGLAEQLLQRAGMEFRDVVRTWIHLREMDRDYGALNRARREFFESRGIDLVPASTGIGGGPVPAGHDLCLGIYAVKAAHAVERRVMTSPTLNEAPEYGADFVRGMRVAEANKVALHVSGTASIDEQGGTAHVGDVGAQAERMLVNIAALLEGQGAGFGDIVSAITYVKHPADQARVLEKLRSAGFAGFPHALVVAPICRPELLCETEALAVLPAAAPGKPAPVGIKYE
jgi:enamine deaminase RidA (YjgF/YER057c/UK114 family)